MKRVRTRTAVIAALVALGLAGSSWAVAAGLGLTSTKVRATADNAVVVPKVADTLTASANPATILLGQTAADNAVIASGTTAPAVSGTITYKLYGSGDSICAAAPVFTTTSAVSGNATYTSASYTPTQTGTYMWSVVFTGDARNVPAPTTPTCGNGGTLTVNALLPTRVNITGVTQTTGGNTKVTFTGTGTALSPITITVCATSTFPCASALATVTATVGANGAFTSTQTGNLGHGTRYAQAVQGGAVTATSPVFTFSVV